MADKISRRSFLKGTGKTILTAGALSSGVLSTSTTPVKTVVPTVTKIVLSPKARAYKSYLRGIRTLGLHGFGTGVKNVITKQRIGSGKTQAIAGKSPARQAFDDSTKKAKRPGVWPTKQERQTQGSRRLASQIAPNPQAKIPPNRRTMLGLKWDRTQETVAKNLTKDARTQLAKELRKKRQERTVRQEKAAGKLGTKARMLEINLRSKPRAYK
tara:strand:- start:44 stop:682 length:639 start_codon:yes stop_codon:yes gene_type:complete